MEISSVRGDNKDRSYFYYIAVCVSIDPPYKEWIGGSYDPLSDNCLRLRGSTFVNIAVGVAPATTVADRRARTTSTTVPRG